MITLDNIDQERGINWIEKRHKNEIIKKSLEQYKNDDGTLVYQEVWYFLKGDIILHFHSDTFLDIDVYENMLDKMAFDLVNELAKFL
jgi:hypothetical protein